MTATNHVLTGALIAVGIQRPWLAIPLAFISHYILDMLPQYGLSYIPEEERDKNRTFRLIVGSDAFLALALYWLFPYLLRHQVTPLTTAVCMIAAQLPDAVWFYRHFHSLRHGQYKEKHWTTKLHKYIQWCERPWGLYFESLYLLAVLAGIYVAS